jgi:hypothetical protein
MASGYASLHPPPLRWPCRRPPRLGPQTPRERVRFSRRTKMRRLLEKAEDRCAGDAAHA